MPNSYADLGGQIGSILARAGGNHPAAARGRTAGLDAGSQYGLRSAQTGRATADRDKVLYELGLAKKANNTSANDIASAMGVPAEMIAALSGGQQVMQPLPSDQGPVQPGAADIIPQGMTDKFNNASTLKVLQQLTGGTTSGANAKTMMDTLLGGQELGTRSNMQMGVQDPGDVATAEAALLGKVPGSGGGGSTSADIQMFNLLTSKRGGGLPAKEALKQVLGDTEAKAIDSMMQALVRSGLYETDEIEEMIPLLLQSRKDTLGGAPTNDPLGLR